MAKTLHVRCQRGVGRLCAGVKTFSHRSVDSGHMHASAAGPPAVKRTCRNSFVTSPPVPCDLYSDLLSSEAFLVQVSGVPDAKLRTVSAGGIHACGLVLETSAFDALGSNVVCWGAKDASGGQASPPGGLRCYSQHRIVWRANSRMKLSRVHRSMAEI